MSNPTSFNPTPPGDLERLHSQLFYFPRPTQYQQFCFRIAEKSLDLPVFDWHGQETSQDRLLRHLGRLDAWTVQRWLLEAAQLDGLAAMVILDAMEFLSDCLRFVMKTDETELFDSRFKGEFTKSIHGLPFIFRVPSGWELSLFNHGYDEGNYGVGFAVRCHLSQSTTHENWGLGKLLGRGNAYSTDIGYFYVPCEIVPQFKRMPIDVDDERWGGGIKTVTASIPYQWIIQTRRREADGKSYSLRAAPSESEIIELAVKAIDAVKELLAKIQARRQEAENDGRSDRENDV